MYWSHGCKGTFTMHNYSMPLKVNLGIFIFLATLVHHSVSYLVLFQTSVALWLASLFSNYVTSNKVFEPNPEGCFHDNIDSRHQCCAVTMAHILFLNLETSNRRLNLCLGFRPQKTQTHPCLVCYSSAHLLTYHRP